ncbi:unnamed protein product [Meloidogyne enterolobii]|uniref:Uncharacterized protein n=1 Tax=Meloidogyne enterolobii TaxID=390850 RepID=A0ACB1AYV2_MELEN
MNLSFRLKSGLFILINYIILSTLFCNVKTTLFCDENFPGDLRQFCEKMEAGKNNTRCRKDQGTYLTIEKNCDV